MLVADRVNRSVDTNQTSGRSCRPRSYVSKTEDGATLLEVELPGFTSEDVQIRIEDNRLTLRAERKETPEGEVLLGERQGVAREAVFALADELDTQEPEARMKDGVLTLRFDKKPERKPRQINIKRS